MLAATTGDVADVASVFLVGVGTATEVAGATGEGAAMASVR